MKIQDKVLKIKPSATHKIIMVGKKKYHDIHIDGVVYGFQPRESWAWAEALRVINQEKNEKI